MFQQRPALERRRYTFATKIRRNDGIKRVEDK
jgi:hypothetical protein